ncbi:type III secretion system stalk subunit SctO [Shewanella woodyi]|uniref:type III secretion system stalk subunit SctO n=1 Tax=Shewanella woodyi TaxID=60961 RepID=UPI003748AD37
MISQLVKIKKIKADRAEHALRKQQQVLAQANIRLNQANHEAYDYRLWRKEEEQRLFSQAKESSLKLKELEQLQQHIAILHDKEANLKQEAAEIELKRDSEQEALNLCQKAALLANKAIEKFELLQQQADIEQEYLTQYQEEIEQEDRRIMATGELIC